MLTDAQLVVVAIVASTVYLRTRMGTSTLEGQQLALAPALRILCSAQVVCL